MKLTVEGRGGIKIPNPVQSRKHLETALNQLAAYLKDYKKHDRMYSGRPLPEDVYVSPEARADAAPWLANFRYPLMHLVVDQVVKDSVVESITTPNDAATKAIEAVYTRLKANLVLWPKVIHYKEKYGKAYIHGWTDPATGKWKAWVETPLTMQAIKVNGEVVCLARIWEDEGLRRINLMYPDRIEKWASGTDANGRVTKNHTGNVWRPFTEDGYKLRNGAEAPADGTPVENPGDVYDLDENGRVQALWPLPNPLEMIPGVEFVTSVVEELSGMEFGIPIYCAMVKSWAQAVQSSELLGSPSYLAAVSAGQMTATGGPRPTVPTAAATPGAGGQGNTPQNVPIKVGTIIKAQVDNLHRLGGESPDPILAIQNAAILGVGRATATSVTDLDPAMNDVSGISRREARRPYTDKLEGRHALDEAGIADFTAITAKAEGIAVGEEDIITVNFREADKLDDTELWGTPVVKGKQDAGVPIETTLIEQGYTPSEVEEWKKEREAAAQAAVEMAQAAKAAPADAKDVEDAQADGATPKQAVAQAEQKAKGKAIKVASGTSASGAKAA